MTYQARVSCGLLCLIILAGCTVPIFSNSTPFPNPTSVYQTIAAGLTLTPGVASGATRLPGTSVTTPMPVKVSTTNPAAPLPSLSASPDPVEGESGPCSNQASAGRPSIDITVPDGTMFAPGEPFSKVWRLENTGSCTWTADYAVVWFSGEPFGAISQQNFSSEVPSGSSTDITLDMVAPDVAGIHQGNWKLRSADGTLFGIGPSADAPFWVRIEVEASAATTEVTQPAPTATFAVAAKDTVMLNLNDGLDLDIGKINGGTADDLGIVNVNKPSAQLAPLNGARLGLYGADQPEAADCRVATLSSDGILLTNIPENSYICYRTNQGLPGFGRLSNITEKSFTLVYTTWMVP